MSKDDGTEEAKGGLLDETVQYHVQLKKGDISDFVILPGDPGRVEFIAVHDIELFHQEGLLWHLLFHHLYSLLTPLSI